MLNPVAVALVAVTENLGLSSVEARRDRLLDAWGDAPVAEPTLEPAPGSFERWRDLVAEGRADGAYVLVRRPPDRSPELRSERYLDGPERERVLLVLHRGSSEFALPGGGTEPGESLAATACRELREEVGITAELTGLGHLRHETATCGEYDERLHALRAHFEAEYRDGSLSVQSGELDGAVWFAEPPDDDDRLRPAAARRVGAWRGE